MSPQELWIIVGVSVGSVVLIIIIVAIMSSCIRRKKALNVVQIVPGTMIESKSNEVPSIEQKGTMQTSKNDEESKCNDDLYPSMPLSRTIEPY